MTYSDLTVAPDEDFFVVAIGASAGGLQALEAFFGHLPPQLNAGFVVLQHLSPDFRSMMVEILQRQTQLTVCDITDGTRLQPNTVYVLPPRQRASIVNHHFQLEPTTDSLNYPINHFFQSLAIAIGDRAIGILLSGTGSDGTEGLKAIGRAGGVALVQSPETAQFSGMPNSAIPSGLVDEILSPHDLADAVVGIIYFASNYPDNRSFDADLIAPEQLQRILDILAEREQINFAHYKISTLSRRITHRCALSRCSSLQAYIHILEESETEQKQLRHDLLIGATRFFRDAEAWQIIEQQVLPELVAAVDAEGQLRIWISACATGEEAYTMAILVDEAIARADKKIRVKIFATDLDENALSIAAKGEYATRIADSITPERLERYFTDMGSLYKVKRALREMLIFAPHDLTKNAGFSKMHLVCCRNVMIYMQPPLQQQVLRLLHFSLAPNGILFLGNSETLGGLRDEFNVVNEKWKIFRKLRDVQLVPMPMTRQPMLTSVAFTPRSRSRSDALDRATGAAFRFCLGDRQMTCVLVNRDNQIIQVFYNAANVLEFPLGQVRLDITDVVRPELKLPLSTALHRAKREQTSVLYSGIRLNQRETEGSVTVQVGPARDDLISAEYLIVVFEVEMAGATSAAAIAASPTFEMTSEAAQQITELEYELQQTRENLQVTIEELETTNEEQQATNEELLASNEELQSTNEELQSVNEELYTVNTEYQVKIEELTQLSNDIDNLLWSTQIGVVFLDAELKIRKFTPAVTSVNHLRPTDLGRPLRELTHNLQDCHDLLEQLGQVIQTGQPIEREVSLNTSSDILLMRLHPYQRDDHSKSGIVMTFVNINQLKAAQQALQARTDELEYLYQTVPIGLGVINADLVYVRANNILAQMNGWDTSEALLGRSLTDLTNPLAINAFAQIQQVLATQEPILNVESVGEKPHQPDVLGVWLTSYHPLDLLNGEQAVGITAIDITDLKQTQTALAESQILVQRITDASPVMLSIFEIPSGKVRYINQAVFDLLGCTPQEIYEIGEEILVQQIHPEDIPVVVAQFTELAEAPDHAILSCEFRMRHQREGWRWVYQRNTVFRRNALGQPIEILGVGTDITSRKQAEQLLENYNQTLEAQVAERAEALRQSETRFQNLAINMPGVVFRYVLRSDGSEALPYVSPGCVALWELEAAQIEQNVQLLWDLVHPEDQTQFKASLLASAETLAPWEYEWRVLPPSGQMRWLYGKAKPERLANDAVVWDGLILDISDRKQTEMELRQAKQAAESANRAKSEFLANMSHEIRTPLTTISGFSQLLARSPLTDEQQLFLDSITRSGHHLLAIINDLLDLSKLEAGDLSLSPEPLLLRDLLDSLVLGLKPRADAKHLALSLEYGPNVPHYLLGPATRLRQVVLNLAVNAIKFTEAGSVKIRVASQAVLHQPERVLLRITVQDTGIGIDEAAQPIIFEPFAQVPVSRQANPTGVGLGLAICRKIVQLMGGELQVESAVGQGSTFWFTVPLELDQAAIAREAQAVGGEAAAAPPQSLAMLKVLIVDDEAANNSLFQMLLRRDLNCVVQGVFSGEAALELLERERFDLVLMDCRMPDVDGYEVTRRIRARERGEPRTVIIGLTASAMIGDREKCLAAGMDAYLSKPFEIRELRALIEQHLNLSRPERSP